MTIIGRFIFFSFFCLNFSFVWNHRFSLNEKRLLKEIRQILVDWMSQDEVSQTIPLSNDEIQTLINELTFKDYLQNPLCFQDEMCAIQWLTDAQSLGERVSERNSYLSFIFKTNITDYNEKSMEDFAPFESQFQRIILDNGKKFFKNSNNWNKRVKRLLKLISSGSVLTDEEDIKKFAHLSSELESIYAKGKVCADNGTCYSLEPGLSSIMAKSRNYDELLWAWKGWANATGPYMKDFFTESISLQNKAARAYGYTDLSEIWMEDFETSGFEVLYDKLFEQLKPFYQQLHAYTRRKLRDFYGSDKVSSKYIPAHLTGNMWAQSWDSIYDILAPYPDVSAPRVTDALLEKNYTAVKIFKESENFFTSIGLYKMTPTFWKYSMITRPNDRDVQCHASAISYSNDFDFRIKMCTQVAEDDFFVVHHEMGHIEYHMSYRNQPFIFRNGANSGFHEAIGDTIALSVFTSKHLKTIGVLDSVNDSNESNINFLMNVALKKLAFLPFGYLIDKWRWDVFRGKITPDNYTSAWWKMRRDYQGVDAPIERTEHDFDPGNKYHIPANVPYARYFMSHIHQFQFYRALCKLANHTGPLHTCDFYQSEDAGRKLKEMLSLGSSKHWVYALKLLTGEQTANMDAFIEYFEPLLEWLKNENEKYPDDKVGW